MRNVIKNYFKNLGIRGIFNWVLLIAIVVGMVRGCYTKRKYQSRIDSLTAVQAAPETPVLKEAEEISRSVDSLGRERVIYREAEPIIQKIEDSAKLDSIAKVAGTRADRISQITQINGVLSKENTDLKRIISDLEDGSSDTSFGYTDPWVSISGYRYNDSTFRISNIMAPVNVSTVSWNHKKYWFFGKNEDRVSIVFDNPYIRVNGLKTMNIKTKEPFVDFNVDVEAKYLHTPQEILIGPKLGIDIGRLKLQGGYYLNPGGQMGNTVWYGAGYSIF